MILKNKKLAVVIWPSVLGGRLAPAGHDGDQKEFPESVRDNAEVKLFLKNGIVEEVIKDVKPPAPAVPVEPKATETPKPKKEPVAPEPKVVLEASDDLTVEEVKPVKVSKTKTSKKKSTRKSKKKSDSSGD